jgi:hypothetical protein
MCLHIEENVSTVDNVLFDYLKGQSNEIFTSDFSQMDFS